MPAKGIERVRKSYRRTVERIAGQVSEGAVYEILSQGGAMAATMTPIDTSNLINSQYAPQIEQNKGKVSGHIGYTAEYASAVHEAPGTLAGQPRKSGNGDYWDPNAEREFLSKGFDEIKPAIPAILKRNYRNA
ncbi:hypothetical protein [Eoetvoesiella caeni]|uniref:HK97 gp10 family phage protein n=1 Tax=Eoetvoesiella caeni TaxID=645616 RepID=A0A366HAC3_9BURK|nr:hypothetical protein [Eoetvoesiella caeni]MCI2809389.1 hypothetical protein [Eoetvoesiella caeni]NYT54530.1 hypothetical protein [Eoetvoesiella caeni]RBP39280.1 hypothetical protein DFR37_10571 [Eoetvoesiella caeni]